MLLAQKRVGKFQGCFPPKKNSSPINNNFLIYLIGFTNFEEVFYSKNIVPATECIVVNLLFAYFVVWGGGGGVVDFCLGFFFS